jgi:hypothetical protein
MSDLRLGDVIYDTSKDLKELKLIQLRKLYMDLDNHLLDFVKNKQLVPIEFYNYYKRILRDLNRRQVKY